jgi:antitoxin CptB|tara:strand:- start:43 stop:303 length:261 start_codon:yes stop_codon:yes gene_type:complete
MKINKDDIKKRIIYRASYRGTKEMDVLISSFVNSIIDNLNNDELLQLEKFVNLNDEDLIKLNKYFSDVKAVNVNRIYKEFYNFKPI